MKYPVTLYMDNIFESFLKDRPGPGYDKSKKDRITPLLTCSEPQLVLYIFEPASLRETEHPEEIFKLENIFKLKEAIPEPWKNRTVLKFIPSSILAAPMSYSFDKLASEVFRSVSVLTKPKKFQNQT